MVIIISYNKQKWNEYDDSQTADKNLANGAIISADRLNHMETGISNNDINKVTDNHDGTIEVNGSSITPTDGSKFVRSTDMRKPANDVAGIEEVNVKQDKIGYTPADASRVVHNTGAEEIAGQKTFDTAPIDKKTGNPYITKSNVPKVDLSNYVIDNKDNTIKANDVNYDLSKTGITPIGFVNSGSFNDLPLGTVLADANSMTDGPSKSNAFTTTTFSSSKWGGRKAQIAISDNVNLMYFRVEGYNGGSITWNSWVLLSDDSAVVHKTGTEEIAGQKTFTAAQTFSIAPTIKDASKDKGDNQAATMADLKSVKKSAWHIMSGSSDIFSTYNCWYKINKDKKRLEIIVLGIVQSNDGTVVDLSSIITSISRIDGTFNYFSNGQASGETPNYDGAEMRSYGDNMDSGCIAEIIHDSLNKSRVTANPAYIYYDGLQDAYK